MKKRTAPLVVLLDEGAPAAIADSFEAAGHRVIRFADVLSPGTKDEVVCATAILNAAVLVATDRDMKQMVKRFGQPEQGGRFAKMHLLHVTCNGVLAPKRVAHAMSFIEHEWKITCEKPARSMWLDIASHYLRSYR